jgi:magnesium transporter
MITTYTHGGIKWVDVLSPTREEIRELMEKYAIHPHIAEELQSPSLKPRLDMYENQLYVILHFPAVHHTHKKEAKKQEIDFILRQDTLITVRYDTIDALHKFEKIFEVQSILNTESHTEDIHTGFLFFFMIQKLYKSLIHELEYMESALGHIEEEMFLGHEKDMVVSLSEMSRELIDFGRAISYHEEILDSLQIAGKTFYGNDFIFYLRRIVSEYRRVEDMLQGLRAYVAELRETNNSLVSTKQNEVMKVLTIMAFVTFPLSLIASIFGMNTLYLPIVGRAGDFWIVIELMAILTLIMFWYFKHKKWL